MKDHHSGIGSYFSFPALVVTTFILISCGGQGDTPDNRITLTNPLDMEKVDEPVVISRDQLIELTGTFPEGMLPVVQNGQDELLASQVDDIDLDGEWDELAFLADIPAGSSLNLTIQYRSEEDIPEFSTRTNIRFGVKQDSEVEHVEELEIMAEELPTPPFARFQMDGPAWENDKVGFRQYIDGRNARDLYGKRTADMVLDPVGLSDEGEIEDNYHELRDWGRDILAVGNSLGIGGLAVLHENEPVRLGITLDDDTHNIERTHYQQISSGPVRSMFTITYEGWQVGDESYDLENRVTIWGGKYLHANDVTIHSDAATDTLVVGLVNINNDKPVEQVVSEDGEWTGILTHDQQTYEKDYYLGMGLILPTDNYLEYREAPNEGSGIIQSYNVLLEASNGESIRYYVTAGWELSDSNFTDRDYFFEYAETEMNHISNPAQVK